MVVSKHSLKQMKKTVWCETGLVRDDSCDIITWNSKDVDHCGQEQPIGCICRVKIYEVIEIKTRSTNWRREQQSQGGR